MSVVFILFLNTVIIMLCNVITEVNSPRVSVTCGFSFSGDNALWLDGDLHQGHSGPSHTFGNDILTEKADFKCSRVEVLGFLAER